METIRATAVDGGDAWHVPAQQHLQTWQISGKKQRICTRQSVKGSGLHTSGIQEPEELNHDPEALQAAAEASDPGGFYHKTAHLRTASLTCFCLKRHRRRRFLRNAGDTFQDDSCYFLELGSKWRTVWDPHVKVYRPTTSFHVAADILKDDCFKIKRCFAASSSQGFSIISQNVYNFSKVNILQLKNATGCSIKKLQFNNFI